MTTTDISRPSDHQNLTLLRRITERTFIHEAARVSYTVPEGWKEIRPHRLERKIDVRVDVNDPWPFGCTCDYKCS